MGPASCHWAFRYRPGVRIPRGTIRVNGTGTCNDVARKWDTASLCKEDLETELITSCALNFPVRRHARLYSEVVLITMVPIKLLTLLFRAFLRSITILNFGYPYAIPCSSRPDTLVGPQSTHEKKTRYIPSISEPPIVQIGERNRRLPLNVSRQQGHLAIYSHLQFFHQNQLFDGVSFYCLKESSDYTNTKYWVRIPRHWWIVRSCVACSLLKAASEF